MPEQKEITQPPAGGRGVIAPGYTFGTVTDQIASVVLSGKTPLFWMACLGVGFALVLLLLFAAAVSQPAHLGRLRGVDLRDGQLPVLVRRAAAGPGESA